MNWRFSFQVASDARGRGVLRLLLRQQQINLLCIPALCLQVVLLTYPSTKMPPALCLSFDIAALLVCVNRIISIFTIALGR